MADAKSRLTPEMPRCKNILMVAASVAALSCADAVVLAQQEPLVGLEPVEQTVADRGPLSTSLRWVQYGLREPYGFQQLYQLPVGERNYVRRNAGLWAVFPRSLYVTTQDGTYTTVPAGTVYYIGGPTEVIPRISKNQEAYVPVGRLTAERVDQSRIEAELVDSRVPSSSIDSTVNDGLTARLFLSAEDHPPKLPDIDPGPEAPGSIDLGQIPNEMDIRREWESSCGNLSFIHDEEYRRRCLRAAISIKPATRSDRVSVPPETTSD